MTNLISGKEALIALANGQEVEYWCENDPSIQKKWTPIKSLSEYKLSYFLENKPRFEFRLKPRTITLNNIEVPAPFEPKEDCLVYILDDSRQEGFREYDYDIEDTGALFFGVWRDKDEIKQVVAALRSVFKGGV